MSEVGFSEGRPVAAVMIFKGLMHWRFFEADRTNVFDKVILSVSKAVDTNADNNDALAYWLSNTAVLLALLQRTLRTAGAGGGAGAKGRNRTRSMGLLERWKDFRSSGGGGGGGGAAAVS